MALGWLATRGLMGYGAYEVDKQVFGGWTWDKLVNGVKDIGRSILEDDNAPPAPSTNATTSTTTDPNAASTASPASEEEGSTLDHLKDTATRTRDQLADGDYLGALSTVAGATRGDEPDADNDDDDGWSWWQKTLAVFAGGYTGKKVLWDWTLSNFFGGDDNNNDNNGSGWFGKLMTAGIVIGAVITAAMHWKELKGMATSAFNSVTGNDNAPSADVSSTNTYSSEQISAYFKNTAEQDQDNTRYAQPALDTSASLFGSALGGAASAQINQPNPSNVKLDASQLKPVTTSQVSGSFAGQISANDGIDADRFSSNGSKPVIFNAMATAAEKQTPVQENRGRVAGSDLTETLDAE